MFFALYSCICVVFVVIVCFVFRILYLLAGWEGVGSILHYLAPASLSWGEAALHRKRKVFKL